MRNPQDIRSLFMQSPIIEISAMQKQGVEDLKELIVKHVARDLSLEEGFTTASHRFLEELQTAVPICRRASGSLSRQAHK